MSIRLQEINLTIISIKERSCSKRTKRGSRINTSSTWELVPSRSCHLKQNTICCQQQQLLQPPAAWTHWSQKLLLQWKKKTKRPDMGGTEWRALEQEMKPYFFLALADGLCVIGHMPNVKTPKTPSETRRKGYQPCHKSREISVFLMFPFGEHIITSLASELLLRYTLPVKVLTMPPCLLSRFALFVISPQEFTVTYSSIHPLRWRLLSIPSLK